MAHMAPFGVDVGASEVYTGFTLRSWFSSVTPFTQNYKSIFIKGLMVSIRWYLAHLNYLISF